jgi:hypothetical protein
LPPLRTPKTHRGHSQAASPTFPAPSVSSPVEPPATASIAHDWTAEALSVAEQVSGRLAAAARRSSVNASKPPEPFPWTRAPLTPWFDFDPDSFVTTLKLGPNCQIDFFFPVAGFGCPGQAPARGDLFDPQFEPEDVTATLP